MKHTYYTALGRLTYRHDGPGKRHPIIIIAGKEYGVDPQELLLWTCLNWRLIDKANAERHYDELAAKTAVVPTRTFEDCLARLITRGLVASGTGETRYDALYDLLAQLYVVPVTKNIPLKIITFLKMVFLNGVPISKAKRIFQSGHLTEQEQRVMDRSRQALLSTAELVKCEKVKAGDLSTDEKVLEALYNDDYTTSDNIQWEMRYTDSAQPVTMAVANLYLRKQITFDRV